MDTCERGYGEKLNKQESDILYSLYQDPFVNQQILSELSGHSIRVVNRCIKQLKKKDYLDDRLELTERARELFKQYKPKNAIILAAGLGMRMVPINKSTSKALMEVNGEKLIERIIKQLHEVGITNIIVVVGYMKDNFQYLINKFGVELEYNPEFSQKNNLYSLALVKERIGNTYIIPCDIWCDKNPFRGHELYSWYMVSDLVDDNSDVRVNRKMELVKIAKTVGGNGMIGICYLTKDIAPVIKEQLNCFSQNNDYDSQFWEETLYKNDKMIVRARVVHFTDVVEINTYEQLRELDADSDHLKSDALKVISSKFCCRESDIVDIEMLKKGMTNHSFLFGIDKGDSCGRYIMRIPGEGTDYLINRSNEAKVYTVIKGLGFCDDPIYINPQNGYKITRFIDGVRCCDPKDEDDLYACMKKIKKLHASNLTVPHTFDLFERIDFYESLWNGNSSIYDDYETTKGNCRKLIPFIDKYKEPFRLTHIDAVPDNFLFDPNVDGELHIQLTDWEYSGMQDPHVDIAMFCIYSCYNKQQIDRLIDIYFEDEGGCTIITRAKIYCYISVCGLIWSNWCEYKRILGVEFGEYSIFQYRYSKEYYRYAMEIIQRYF